MIAHLSGRLLRKSPQAVVIDVAGVGYRAFIPVSTFYRLGEEGSAVSLRIHTHVREDALALFGFASAAEHDLFDAYAKEARIRSSDVVRLVRIPGVGRKTAERLVVELKDKMPAAAAPGQPAPGAGTPKEDLLSALANLGYSRGEAERGVERALRDDGTGRFEDLLRRALQVVAGR